MYLGNGTKKTEGNERSSGPGVVMLEGGWSLDISWGS